MTDEAIANWHDRDITPRPDPTRLTNEALAREIRHLKELMEAKFLAIGREMEHTESDRVELKQDSLDSLAAALSAAKEAVGANTMSFEKRIDKSEAATNDQLRQLGEKFDTVIEGLLRSLSDLKEREAALDQSVATHMAAGSEKEKATDKIQPWVFAIIMAVIATVSIIIQLSH